MLKKNTMKNFGILLLAMVSCCLLQAKNRVVKQPPFIARSSSTIEIDRVVVSDTATVLDIKAFFRPHNWIQISNESYLLADKPAEQQNFCTPEIHASPPTVSVSAIRRASW